MLFQKATGYIIAICISGAIVASCLGSSFQVNPDEINQAVRSLAQEQDNIITKEAIIGPFTENVEQSVLLVHTAPQHPTPDQLEKEATLAKLHTTLELLETQQLEAQADLIEREKQFSVAQETSLAAHSAANEALNQLSSITSALHEYLHVFRQVEESSGLAAAKLEKQKSQTEKARSLLRSTELQWHEIVADYQATKKSAEIAEKSANEAHRFAFGDGNTEFVIH